MINVTAELKDDCKLVPRGCFRVKKGTDADTVILFQYVEEIKN